MFSVIGWLFCGIIPLYMSVLAFFSTVGLFADADIKNPIGKLAIWAFAIWTWYVWIGYAPFTITVVGA